MVLLQRCDSGSKRKAAVVIPWWRFFCAVFMVVFFLVMGFLPAQAQENKPKLPSLNRFPRMMQEYIVRRVRWIETRANKRRASLKTRADAEKYIREVRRKIKHCFGPWPEKTPLNSRVVGTVERDSYKIEKIIFESRPGFLVTANLYIPKGRDFPLPAVVGACGHSAQGKAYKYYQGFSQGLARQGYVVLIYDPISQGERLQYTNDKLQSTVGACVPEHIYAGNQQFLVGEFFGTWRAWDGIRALDYLLTRKEVDRKHIGLTGNSGGGTMTTWLSGLDKRWAMTAPGCFVTTMRRNIENELPQDTEQCPPGMLASGLDHSDFIACMAPKPVILLGKEKDFFDIRGLEEAYGRLQRLYSLLGAEKNIAMFAGPGYHGYSQENREAMYRWFNGVTGISRLQSEPKLVLEKDETLWCTPQGQVAGLHSKPIYEFTREKAEKLAATRPKNPSATVLKASIRQVLKLDRMFARKGSHKAPYYRILRNWRSRKYPRPYWTTYVIETEPFIQAVVYRLNNQYLGCRPPRGIKRAVLYISHLSSDAELREEPLIREILQAEPDAAFYTCDVRGIGESRPDTCDENSYLSIYGSDFFYASNGIMLDRPYVGQRTYDVLRVIDWLKALGHEEIHLVGKGWGALPATFAAVLSDSVRQVTLKNALISYTVIAESKTYAWPLSCLLPNVLKYFDLPDCYHILQQKQLRQVEPWNEMAQPVTVAQKSSGQ